MTTVGSLFTGYGALDMGVMIALDSSARIAWTSDVEPGPCKLAAVRWPDGHVTGTDLALPREQQLRLLGNGVVPQQAALAVRTITETALRYGAAQ